MPQPDDDVDGAYDDDRGHSTANRSPREYVMGALVCWGIGAAFLAWGAIALGPSAVFDINDPDFIPFPAALAAILFVAGLNALFKAWRIGKVQAAYGQIVLDAKPARLGRRFRGVVRTSRDVVTKGPFRMRLACTRHSGFSRGGGSPAALWEAFCEAQAATRSSGGIPFSFDLPENGLPSVARSGDDGGSVYWTLHVTAPAEGPVFREELAVDVIGADGSTEAPRNLGAGFAGLPRPEQGWQRIMRFVAPPLGLLFALAGGAGVLNQWQYGQTGLARTGRIVTVERPSVTVALNPDGALARIARVTKNTAWQTGQAVDVICAPEQETPALRSCRMETGNDRWIDGAGTLAVSAVLLILSAWLWSRWQLRRPRPR